MLKTFITYILEESRINFFFILIAWMVPVVCFIAGTFHYYLQRRQRTYLILWILFGLLAPIISLMWAVYLQISDYFGLDSIKGFFINIFVFVAVGIIVSQLFKYIIQKTAPDPK